MNSNNQADLLAAELDKASEENKKFIASVDEKIKKVDLEYAKALIEEEKGYLKMAKKSLEEEKN